eukprot:3903233-Rhodomonas_salina.1
MLLCQALCRSTVDALHHLLQVAARHLLLPAPQLHPLARKGHAVLALRVAGLEVQQLLQPRGAATPSAS